MKQIFVLLLSFGILAAFTVADKTIPSVQLKTLDGKSTNVLDHVGQGKLTVLSFWATWCTPCKLELDAIAEVYPEWQDKYDVELVAITIDNARQLAKVPGMVASKGWKYLILSDAKQELQKAMNFQLVPQTFLLNQKGEIVYEHNGYSPGDEFELEDQIKKYAKK